MPRPLALLATFALVLGACSTPEVAEPTSTSSTTPATTTSTTQPEDQAADPGSAASFDDAYLSLGPGQSFPVLDDPTMVPASEATWLGPDEIVLGIVNGDQAHAFPAAQMAYHHIVNTSIAGEPYLVTY
jgi:hypothetical protein